MPMHPKTANAPMWFMTKDGDRTCLEMYERHYSCHDYKDGRERELFVGPGEKIVLSTWDGFAFFVWRNFIDDSGQEGINCAAFRNEGTQQSSFLIRQADAIADFIWPHSRHYTYVDEKEVKSGLPGACFLAAGWKYLRRGRRRVRTKSGLLILFRAAVTA